METKTRSLLKALSWRIIASVITGSLVFCFTRQSLLAVSLGICDSLVKILVYFIHERIWINIRWGIRRHPLHELEVQRPLAVEHQKVIRQKLNELGYIAD